MSDSVSIPARWTPYLQSLARIIFGFLLFRHGMEQVLGYPEASGAPRLSYEGIVELIAFPAGILIMLGLFTRPICLALAAMHLVLFFVGPLQRGPFTHRNGGDPILLNAFFFLYLAAAGGGAKGLDNDDKRDATWAPQALGFLRIAAGCLLLMHGLEKFFAIGGGRIDRDITTLRGLGGWLEIIGAPLLICGLFTRPVAFIFSGEMAVAYFSTWAPRGFWPSFRSAGGEASILFCFLFLFLWAVGPGAWSLGSVWQRKRRGGSTTKAERTAVATIAVMALLSGVSDEQWVSRPTPAIPHLAPARNWRRTGGRLPRVSLWIERRNSS